MWPWEHLAVGYLAYSVYSRVELDALPTGSAALAVVLGTQFPDLVDKPLGWVFGVMPDGTTIGHSLFVAVPLSVVVYRLSARRGRPEIGAAFAVGYLSHLPGDVFYPVLRGGGPAYTKLLWPVFTKHGSGGPVVARVGGYSRDYLQFLLRPEGFGYATLELLLLGAALAVWFADGTPGIGWLRNALGGR
jgi:hypothetical protein